MASMLSAAVSAADLKTSKAALSEWQPPSGFIKLTADLMEALGSVQLFNDAGLAFARDSWVAAQLASVTAAYAVRLCPDLRPDYEERVGGRITQYEFTEAILPGRRRGEEYKQAAARGQLALSDGPLENWIARAEKVPEALRTVAEKKALKAYLPTTRLVIYLNISEYGIRSTQIRAAFAESTAPAREAFEQVIVLWGLDLHIVWDKGHRSREVIRLPSSGEV